MMAADCLGTLKCFLRQAYLVASYGSLARFRDVERLTNLGRSTLLGSSGDISDFQYTKNLLAQYQTEEYCFNDGHYMSPRQWHTALSAYQYKRRSDMNPLWNANVIGGIDSKTSEMYV